jgi:hypothetical protein
VIPKIHPYNNSKKARDLGHRAVSATKITKKAPLCQGAFQMLFSKITGYRGWDNYLTS